MKTSHQSIAVVGLGGVFPAALNLDAFWSAIAQARSAAKEVPPERWSFAPDRFAGEPPKADTVASRRACLIEGFRPALDGLDLEGIPADQLDPMFQVLLHAGRAAWSEAVTQPVDPHRAGVIIGSIALPTDSVSRFSDEILGAALRPALDAALGRPSSAPALPQRTHTHPLNRQVCGLPAVLLAQALRLRGLAYTLDAACASSLYAIKLAADALHDRRLDAVVCGGLSRPDSLYTQMGFSQLRALSATGRCAPFDHRADGLVVGEGCGLLVLKRLEDALAHGDHVYGLIADVGLSNDLGANLMSPNTEGQLRAIRDAYRRSGWSPQDIDLVECHGTGTPVGDAVEFHSMREAWGEAAPAGACVIGSVKSNVGHLLTGAGAAGLIKVLLAMRHQTLPPTAHFDSAAERIALPDSPFRILKTAEPWSRRDAQTPRRAAVSAFGFGGVNAHLLVEEFLPQRHEKRAAHDALPAPRPAATTQAVAIVGMGVHFGAFDSLDRFAAQVLGDAPEAPSSDNHWRGLSLPPELQGYRVNSIEFPAARFRIPPAEIREMLPQQLIMLEVAAAALNDTGRGESSADEDRLGMGIYVGIGLDLETTNFHFRWNAARWLRQAGGDPSTASEWLPDLRQAAHPPLSANRTMGALGSIAASRLARAFRAGGPCYTVACEALSGMRALDIAVAALMREEIDSALVGAVDFACDPRGLVADARRRSYGRHDAARPFSADSGGTVAGEGAAALVLKRLEDAEKDGDQVYAVICGAGASLGGAGGRPDAAAYAQALNAALASAGWQLTDIDYLEAHRSGDPVEDRAEIDGLAALAHRRRSRLNLTVGSAKPRIGHTGASAGLASVVKAAIGLHRRTVPALGAPAGGGRVIDASESTIHAPGTARYWLKDRTAGPRRAVVAAIGAWGDCAHLCLEQAPESVAVSDTDATPDDAESLFVIGGAAPDAMLDALTALSGLCDSVPAEGLGELARRWHQEAGVGSGQPLAVAIVAPDAEGLRDRIERARQAVSMGQAAFENGVFFTPVPQGNAAQVAFVFPGSGNQYPAMGQVLAQRFPAVMATLERENGRLASQFADARPWRLPPDSVLTPKDAILAHVWFGALASDVLHRFELRPDAVIGYSLGESTGLIATRAWSNRDELFQRVERSTLFSDQLAGDCKAVRNVWGLSAAQQIDWRVGVVDRPADAVRDCLRGRRWVYLLIINTPGECVIGGHREAVDEVVRALGCGFHPLDAVTTVHCEVSKPVADRYRALHLLPTRAPAGIRFYSAAWGRAYAVDREAAADSILAQAVAPFDFTRVVESAYRDGVRVFIEAGPGRSATRMIQNILGDRPHLAVAAFPGGFDETGCLLRALARLATERVVLNLDALYPSNARKFQDRVNDPMRIQLDAPRFEVPPPPKPNAAVLPLAARGESIAKAAETAPAGGMPAGGSAAAAAPLVEQARRTQVAHAQAQASFLELSERQSQLIARAIDMQIRLAAASPDAASDLSAAAPLPLTPKPAATPAALDRNACLEFATGKIGDVLGAGFAAVDAHPTRVRLPDEPLMLVDRILKIDAEPKSLSRGRVVTEHDVLANAWYLDAGRIPTCIAVEAGQADLFLCAYLGIDFETRGLAVYRLLDARITFYGSLPRAGETIHYDIRIDGFFEQGDTRLFRFAFDASVNGEPLLSMRDGCAGFFTEAELEAGKGIVKSGLDSRPPAAAAEQFSALAPTAREHFDEGQLDALRRGDLAGCFGDAFAHLPLRRPAGIPGGRMKLVDRILDLDPRGGRYGGGIITAEADIHPDDWFLKCHFVDDQVMPGTLMYECCLHTLRVYLLRVGWVGEADEFVYEPIPGVASSLKCRGQVTALTHRVQYEISVREMGYAETDGTPYVIADALMYADGKPIVQMSNMSLRLSGLTKERLEGLWSKAGGAHGGATAPAAIFDSESILAFAVGNPSDAFGAPYEIFDHSRRIARLPGPPYKFLDRITRIDNCRAFELEAGGVIDAQYDVPEDAWYFASNRQPRMPFAVLLEVALQPCGWLAAYLGSALTSEQDLSFRNLGGTGVQHRDVGPGTGTLTTEVKITQVSRSGGMIIQNFEFCMRDRAGPVYTGDTYFGFFSADALRDQVGIRDASPDAPAGDPSAAARRLKFPDRQPFPDATLRMVDDIEAYLPGGGRHGEGYIRGGIDVDASAWFFQAHFFQDPVWPGSLGVESFLQLLKFVAADRFGLVDTGEVEFECPALDHGHEWIYRGQVLPQDQRVTVHLHVISADLPDRTLHAEGLLSVDGRIIYQMKNFSVRVKN